MPSRYYYRDLLEDHPALLIRMMSFNAPAAPSPTGHPVFDAALHDAVLNRAWERRLGFRAAAPLFWDFSEESRRLALLSEDDLLQLGKTASAALLSPLIRQTVLKRDVLSLRDYYGEPLMHYALYRGTFEAGRLTQAVAPFYAGSSPAEAAQILTSLSLTLPRLRWPQELKDKTADLWRALHLVPVSIPESMEPFAAPLWHFLKKLILREFNSPWKTYFE